MKILAANKYYYLFGGSERYYFELNKLLEDAGHQIIPFAMQHHKNHSTPYEKYFVSQVNYWDSPSIIEKIRAAGRVIYSTEANEKLEDLIKATRPDIAHLHLIYHQIPPSFMSVLKRFNIPIVHTLHDYKPICPTYSLVANNEICERCKGQRFYHAALQRCNHESFFSSLVNTVEMYFHHLAGYYDIPDVFITPSNFMREKMIEFGMPPEKLFHIPNFVEIRNADPRHLRKKQLIYVGRLVEIKGLLTLVEAMRQVGSDDYKLLIVGEGPQENELRERVTGYRLKNIHFCGYQTKENVYRLLAESQFCILPSVVYENCPLSVLESMAVGTPVIGSRIGGIPELIADGQDGLLFEPRSADNLAEKINTLIADPSIARQMGELAREKIRENYNPTLHSQQVLRIYQKVIGIN